MTCSHHPSVALVHLYTPTFDGNEYYYISKYIYKCKPSFDMKNSFSILYVLAAPHMEIYPLNIDCRFVGSSSMSSINQRINVEMKSSSALLY